MRISDGSGIWLSAWSVLTVVPKCAAIDESVSLATTRYVRVDTNDGDGAEVGDAAGDEPAVELGEAEASPEGPELAVATGVGTGVATGCELADGSAAPPANGDALEVADDWAPVPPFNAGPIPRARTRATAARTMTMARAACPMALRCMTCGTGIAARPRCTTIGAVRATCRPGMIGTMAARRSAAARNRSQFPGTP